MPRDAVRPLDRHTRTGPSSPLGMNEWIDERLLCSDVDEQALMLPGIPKKHQNTAMHMRFRTSFHRAAAFICP